MPVSVKYSSYFRCARARVSATVYGFFQFTYSTAPSTTVYQKEGSQLTGYFGFVNGTHFVSFIVPDSRLFALILCITLHACSTVDNRYIKSFTTGVLSSAATRLQVTLNIIPDNIALQPPSMVPVLGYFQ